MKRTTMLTSWAAATMMAMAAWASVNEMPAEMATQSGDIPDVVVYACESNLTQTGDIPDLLVVADKDGNTTAYTMENGSGPLPDVVVIAEREASVLAKSGAATDRPTM